MFKLRGKGVPYLRGNGRGDQVVVTRVVIPTRLTDHQRRLFQQLEEALEPEDISGNRDENFLGRLKSALGL
jgi:molecular chaperone DnaJ